MARRRCGKESGENIFRERRAKIYLDRAIGVTFGRITCAGVPMLRAVKTEMSSPAPTKTTFENVQPGELPPTLAEVSPEFAEFNERRSSVIADRDSARKKASVLWLRISAGDSASESRKRKTEAIISGSSGASSIESDRAEHQRLLQFIEDVDAALPEMDLRILRARNAGSAIIVELIRDEHARLIAEICRGLLQAHAASLAYSRFTGHLNADNVAWGLLDPSFPLFLGAPSGSGGRAGAYVRTAAKAGNFPASEIPPGLRQ
jgi:hypothetical protein